MQKKLALLFDSIRDPRDLAEMIFLSLALDVKIILTGSSLSPSHPKVIKIINSWMPGFKANPELDNVETKDDFFKTIKGYKKRGFLVIGTSPNSKNNLFSQNYSKGKHLVVFGNESSGLSEKKLCEMNTTVSAPMKNNTKFFTIRAIAPVFGYELLRQKNLLI